MTCLIWYTNTQQSDRMVSKFTSFPDSIDEFGNVTREPGVTNLANDVIEIWRVDLSGDGAAPSVAQVLPWLSNEEQTRKARLKTQAARRRFLYAHAALRQILAEHLNSSASALDLAEDVNGKPYLAPRLERRRSLAFNLSHSSDIALVAVCRGGHGRPPALGVDVEVLRPVPEIDGLIALACTESEKARLSACVDSSGRAALFLDFWTRKEAALKAVGHGLRLPLNAIETARGPFVAPDPVGAPGDFVRIAPIRLEGAVGALAWRAAPCEAALGASEGRPIALRHFDWARAAGQNLHSPTATGRGCPRAGMTELPNAGAVAAAFA